MVLLWYYYVIIMVLLWYYYGIIMVLPTKRHSIRLPQISIKAAVRNWKPPLKYIFLGGKMLNLLFQYTDFQKRYQRIQSTITKRAAYNHIVVAVCEF
jgi:hypothetical protein